MALYFTVAYANTLETVTGMTPNTTVYAEDLNLCGPCVSETGSCWSCLQTTQQVFSDVSLTLPVVDGFYMLFHNNDSSATWNIENGYPKEAGFFN